MGRAGKALKQVLQVYSISQNKLAVAMQVRRSVIYRWVHELTDPTGDTIAEIAKALQGLNPAAAEAFVRLYLGDFMQNGEQSQEQE
jgi:transcriptional regulator with XRE-family HTH domain